MAKRQLRLSREALSEKWSEISNKKVNIVLNNGSVLFVRLLECNTELLMVENTRLKRQSVAVKEISEIIVDIKA